jgi:hypothetical protein
MSRRLGVGQVFALLARRLRQVAMLALFALPLTASAAAASPGTPIEPPVQRLAPSDFGSVPVTKGGVDVSYTCPSYPSGGGSDYAVRFSNGDEKGTDGRLIAAGLPYFAGEAPAQPGLQAGTCFSHLQLPATPSPAALYLGVVAWQVTRRCAGCQYGWEVGPLGWVFLTPNVEGAELTAPKHLYAGYLSRFTFHATADLAATELALQGIGPKLGPRGWTDLARTPYDPAGENALIVKLPAGSHRLRLNFYAAGTSQGLPNEEFTVEKPTGPWSTGARDDGRYAPATAGADPGPPSFEVTGMGKALRDLRAPMQVSCEGPAPAPGTLATAIARVRSAPIAPDGTVVGRSLSQGEPRSYVTLAGRLRHRRFSGTVTTTSASCSGSRSFDAVLRPGLGPRL